MSQQTRIREIEVFRFAGLSARRFEVSNGLNVFFGPNESGKSTLQAFLRGVLFGFSKKFSAARVSENWGGRLSLDWATRGVVVRRVASKKRSEGEVTIEDERGQAGTSQLLEAALGHVSESLFAEVFSMTLDELQQFSRLTDERHISEAFLSAQLFGARQLPAVQAQFQSEADALFKAKARVPRLNEKLHELDEVRKRLAALEVRPEKYAMQERETGETDAKLSEHVQQLRIAEIHFAEQSALLEILPLLREAKTLEHATRGDSVNEEIESVSVARALMLAVEEAAQKVAAQQRAVDLIQRALEQSSPVSAQELADVERDLKEALASEAQVDALAPDRAELAQLRA
jgi:uncharacterized protein YhaN